MKEQFSLEDVKIIPRTYYITLRLVGFKCKLAKLEIFKLLGMKKQKDQAAEANKLAMPRHWEDTDLIKEGTQRHVIVKDVQSGTKEYQDIE